MADEGFFENLKQGDIGGLVQNVAEGVRDEWVGLDDFRRFFTKLQEGNLAGALKSLGAGALELGGTVAMFTPAAPLAAASKAGKLGKVLKFIKPLTLEQQAAARGARALGVKPQMFRGLDMANLPIANWATQPATGRLGKFAQNRIIGYGPGGRVGSLLRGAGQLTGQLPAEQGLLAQRAFKARQAGNRVSPGARFGEMLSGKLGSIGMRTGVDTALMDTAITGVLGAGAIQQQPNIIDLYISDVTQGTNYVPEITSYRDAILAQALQAGSPPAAM